MCAVCGAHCATWVGEDDEGNREYTLDCLDDATPASTRAAGED